MRTFLEVIEQRKTDKLAYECFSLMIERGIDPMKYVLWLQETDGLNNPNIRLESREWLDLEIDQINESWLGHNLGWAVGKTPGWLAKGAGAVAGEVGSWFQGAGQGLGSDIDQAMGRKGIQKSPTSPTGYYDTETGHYVKWSGEEGKEDPNQKDNWKTVDHRGNEIPPNSPPPQKPAQQGGNQPGQPGQGGPSLWDRFTGMFSGGQGQNSAHPPGSPQAAAQNAVTALQDLSKRANRRGSKLQQSGIQQMLFDLIQKLQDPNLFAQQQPQQPAQQPTQQPQQPAQQPTQQPQQLQASWTDHGFGSTLRKKLHEIRLKNLADNLVDAGIDPDLFVEWYLEEGMHHENMDDFREDLGQWLHGLWGGIKGSFGDKGFNAGWAEVDDDYDRKSAQAALQAIQPLMNSNPQISKQVEELNTKLREFLWDKAAGGQQPGQPQNGQPPQQNGQPGQPQNGQPPQQNGQPGNQAADPADQPVENDAAQAATTASTPDEAAQKYIDELKGYTGKGGKDRSRLAKFHDDPKLKEFLTDFFGKNPKGKPKLKDIVAAMTGGNQPQPPLVEPTDTSSGSGPVTGDQEQPQQPGNDANWVDPQDVAKAKEMLGWKKSQGEELSDFEKEVEQIVSSGDDEKTQHEKIAAALQKHGHVKGQVGPQAVQNAWNKFVGNLLSEYNFYKSIYGSKKKATWFN